MKHLVAVWDDIPTYVIGNRWISSGIVMDHNEPDLRDKAVLYVQQSENHLNEVVNKLWYMPQRIKIDDILNADEIRVTEDTADDQMGSSISWRCITHLKTQVSQKRM